MGTKFKVGEIKDIKGGLKATAILTCTAHPKYEGKKPPRTLCASCWEIYSFPANSKRTLQLVEAALKADV